VEQAEALVATGCVPVLVASLYGDLLLQREVMYTLLNLGDKGPGFCAVLLECDFVPGPSWRLCARGF
jgi:hypothetical protein